VGLTLERTRPARAHIIITGAGINWSPLVAFLSFFPPWRNWIREDALLELWINLYIQYRSSSKFFLWAHPLFFSFIVACLVPGIQQVQGRSFAGEHASKCVPDCGKATEWAEGSLRAADGFRLLDRPVPSHCSGAVSTIDAWRGALRKRWTGRHRER
jgi:hypothetical protein